MNPMDLFNQQEQQFKMTNLLFGTIFIALSLLFLYYLWKWCSEEQECKKANNSTRLTMKPVYAHEIEPGIVVLQSEDGEYFKILKEYDISQSGNRYGSLSITRPEVQQPTTQECLPYTASGAMLISAHAHRESFQTRSPTAPPELLALELGPRDPQPPPYVY